MSKFLLYIVLIFLVILSIAIIIESSLPLLVLAAYSLFSAASMSQKNNYVFVVHKKDCDKLNKLSDFHIRKLKEKKIEEAEKKKRDEAMRYLNNYNNDVLNNVLYGNSYSVDDMVLSASIENGSRYRTSRAIQADVNSNHDKWKKYYDDELMNYENREWWQNDEEILAKRHIIL